MNWRQAAGWTALGLTFVGLLSLLPGVLPNKQAAGSTALLSLFAAGVILAAANYPRGSRTESDGTAEAAYLDRNLAVLAWACTLRDAGHRVGLRDRDSDWPILTMDLPSGQVSYHIPRDALLAIDLPDYEGDWDDHDLLEKQERVREYINARPAGGEV